MDDASVILEVANLSRVVETASGPKAIVDDFNYHFRRGKIYSVMGPSGAGKSSLLRLINRLDEATSGVVRFKGTDTREIPPCTLRCCVGYLFQTAHLFQGTVRQNVAYARDSIEDTEIMALAAQVRLPVDSIEAPVENLSVGEKQRVALARLLATDPAVALLDEPTSALDPGRTGAIEDLIKSIAVEKDLTVVMVSHSPNQVLRMGGEALLMVDGKLVEHGPAGDLLGNPQTEAGRRFRDRELQ